VGLKPFFERAAHQTHATLFTRPIARACLIDLDAKQLFAKRGHIVEDVGVADIARLGFFAQHAHLAARERQQHRYCD
jgi:endonuclease/exonuclease/phosphatase family metal-dependent hydrolase